MSGADVSSAPFANRADCLRRLDRPAEVQEGQLRKRSLLPVQQATPFPPRGQEAQRRPLSKD